MKTRPLRAGLLIALLGPFLATLPLLIFILAIVRSEPVALLARIAGLTIAIGFVLGVLPATLMAALVAYGIRKGDWISRYRWWFMTILCGAALSPAIFAVNIYMGVLPLDGLGDLPVIFYFLLATMFTSFVLRALIVRLGWMRTREAALCEAF